MRRDNFSELTTGPLFGQSATRFTYVIEGIAKAYEPTDTQLKDLDRAYQATGDYLRGSPEFADLLTQVHAHGSRQMGTIVRPIDTAREGFDIDLVAKLKPDALYTFSGANGQAELLNRLKSVIARYAAAHDLAVTPWDRCVTLVYAGGMCADFVPVIASPSFSVARGEHHGLIPDRKLERYLSTNPKGYCDGFDKIARIKANFTTTFALDSIAVDAYKSELVPLPDATEILARLMCRFVQLAKVHRNIAFEKADEDYVPTSVFLTSLISLAYEQLAPISHSGPLHLFSDIVDMVPKLFQRRMGGYSNNEWYLKNPFALNDNLAESMNTPQHQEGFERWYIKLRADINQLALAINGAAGADSVINVVKSSFGERAEKSLLELNSKTREASRLVNRASFFVGGGASSVSTSARVHTFFGQS